MAKPSQQLVEYLLRQHGLEGPDFDPAEIALTLADWWEADTQLNLLLEGHPIQNPAATFDPRWE